MDYPDVSALNLIFSDDFASKGLDLEKWEHRFLDKPYQEGINSADTVAQLGDKTLRLSNIYRKNQLFTAMIKSVPLFKFGFFEFRVMFPQEQGHHGAVWLTSPTYGKLLNDPARSGSEIDIGESFGSGRSEPDFQQNVYWNAYNSPDRQHRGIKLSSKHRFGKELSDDFHTVSLLWTPHLLVFYLDQVETWRTGEGVSHVPQYIVLSNTSAKWERNRLNVKKLPDPMIVSSVKVYQEKTE